MPIGIRDLRNRPRAVEEVTWIHHLVKRIRVNWNGKTPMMVVLVVGVVNDIQLDNVIATWLRRLTEYRVSDSKFMQCKASGLGGVSLNPVQHPKMDNHKQKQHGFAKWKRYVFCSWTRQCLQMQKHCENIEKKEAVYFWAAADGRNDQEVFYRCGFHILCYGLNCYVHSHSDWQQRQRL